MSATADRMWEPRYDMSPYDRSSAVSAVQWMRDAASCCVATSPQPVREAVSRCKEPHTDTARANCSHACSQHSNVCAVPYAAGLLLAV